MRTKLSTFCDKIIEAGWLAAALAVPLFFNIYSARTFEPDKITLLRAIVSIMIVAWIISIVEKGFSAPADAPLSLGQRLRGWLKIPFFLPTSLFVLFYLISTIFSISPQVSTWGSYQRMEGAYSMLSYITIFALMAGNLHTREQVDRLVTIIIVGSVPVGLYGIVQHYGLDPLPWAGDVTVRVASTMGNSIFVASYMIMIVPLTVSRLIETMSAIIREEKASWGYTILAAIYIFVLAVQIILVLFSGSRGPMLGGLGAGFVMGLLVLLLLRRSQADTTRLTLKEIGRGVAFVALLGLSGGVLGGLGYLLGLALQGINDSLPLLGAALLGALGFLGMYTYMAAAGRGWRWLWLSWFTIGIIAIAFVVTLNIRGTPLDRYLDPIRAIPYVGRLANVIETEGTGKVRVLIWDAAIKLVWPHPPLGIPGDDLSPEDKLNLIRPLIGYGPESMFNAFAYVYPPDLAHVEARGSSADRSHNETMDSLVITGLLGFLALYFLMFSLFYYTLRWLGWVPDASSRRRLAILLGVCGLIGGLIPLFVDKVDDPYTFVPLGLPFGLITGVVIHIVWQGLVSLKEDAARVEFSTHPLLLIGLLGAIIGHFIEVHFVFSIAATYTYFWIYVGLIAALARLNRPEENDAPKEAELKLNADTTASLEVEPADPAFLDRRRPRKERARRRVVRKTDSSVGRGREVYYIEPKAESLETWVGSQGLALAIILMILTFDFITPQFQFNVSDKNSLSLLWMYIITWLVGLGIAMSDLAIRRETWGGRISWPRAVMLYTVTSLSYFLFYYMGHRLQFSQQVRVTNVLDVITAANVLAYGLVVFYIFLFLLMVLLALMLSWRLLRRLDFWRTENWWLYPPLVLAAFAMIWFKNIDVVRADIYLKDGERYRGGSQWDQAIALHEKAQSIDSDEDFYYLMLALDYQLMAQDGRIDQNVRGQAWQRGEQIALDARNINPYNPDNTGNMGRYYFTLGQVFSREKFADALVFFEKATVLAPSNVIYHNLWAQTLYIQQKYPEAIARLEKSVEIDNRFAPTWLLLGDTYAAMGNIDQTLKSHSESMKWGSDFFDQFLDQRLNFYVSAKRAEDIIAAMQQVALERPTEAAIPCAVGRAYELSGQRDQALVYLEQCRALGDTSDRTAKQMANIYLAKEAFDQALPLYQSVLQKNPNDVEVHSALAFIYARQNRLQEAVQENLQVLQQKANDYDTLKNMAVLYQQMGQWPDALNYAKQAQAAATENDRPSWQQFILQIESRLTPTVQSP